MTDAHEAHADSDSGCESPHDNAWMPPAHRDASPIVADSAAEAAAQLEMTRVVETGVSVMFLTVTIAGVCVGAFGALSCLAWTINGLFTPRGLVSIGGSGSSAPLFVGLLLAIGASSLVVLLLHAAWPSTVATDDASTNAPPIPPLLRRSAFTLITFVAIALIALGLKLLLRGLEPVMNGGVVDVPNSLIVVAALGPILLGALALYMLPAFQRLWSRGTPHAPSGPSTPSMWESRVNARSPRTDAAGSHSGFDSAHSSPSAAG